MQNLPANSTFGKLIKTCFQAPKGWIFAGADFNSLEDYVSALTTRDPNKLKVYLEGYDGHCLRAFAYFPEHLPDIRTAEETDRCFEVIINGKNLLCKSGDFILDSTGNRFPIEDFYEKNKGI